MKIAVIQMNTTADKAVNLAHMAELMDRARETGADLAVSVTGVAGPDSDERGNPVGLVFVGLATPTGTYCRKLDLGRKRRDRIRNVSCNHAYDMLRRYITGLDPEAL